MKHQKRPARKKRPRWELCLYVVHTSPRSVLAIGNWRRICEQHLKADYRLTVVDIVKQTGMARAHNILATPTLVEVGDHRDRTVVGTLAETQKVRQALGVSFERVELASTLPPGFAQIGHA